MNVGVWAIRSSSTRCATAKAVRSRPELAWPDGSEVADPAVLWDKHVLAKRVDAAIAALAPAFREVIVLRELEEMSYEDIARVAGIPLGTVMSRLSRARALLREALREESGAPTATRRRDAIA